MKVTCEIDDYSDPKKPNIRVHSHWVHGGLVELEIGGERYVVSGYELKKAIDNAMNK